MGEPFDLRIDGWDRLGGELFGGPGEGAHALINSSVTLEAGMLGLESSVKCRGPTRFEQRRLRCRESTPDAYRRTRRHRVASRSLGSACQAQARRTAAAPSHGEPPGGASPARPWQCTAAG